MTILAFIGGIFLVILFAKSLYVIRPFEKGLVETLGKYSPPVKEPGLTFVIPFFQTFRKVDMREQVIDVPPQEVITKDNAAVTVDAIIYFRVTDPVRVVYNIANFALAAVKLAQTNLRNIVGELELDQTLTSREIINTKLRSVLDEATDHWGVKVVRVEIQKIEPPQDITDAMSRQMKAERERRATILEAEGTKQSKILRAEGEKQSAILGSEGKALAIKKVAEADKFRIEIVFNAIHAGRPTNDLVAILYLESLEKIADGKSTTVFIPYEASAALGALGGMSELLKKKPNASKT